MIDPISDTKNGLYVRSQGAIRLTDVDEEACAVALIPVSTMMMVSVELVVVALAIPVTVLVLVPLMSAPIIRPQLADSGQQKSGKKSRHRQQRSAVMPRHDSFHK